MRTKYLLDERTRNLILRMYDGTPETITQLTNMLGVPRWRVKNWGQELGVARKKERRWTDEDLVYLEQNLHRVSYAQLAKYLHRTQVSVRLKAKRLGMNKQSHGYTMRSLEDCLGIDHRAIEKWIARGWLRGTRRQTEREHDVWYFSNAEVRRFIVRHPEEIDQRRVGWLWVVDLLSGGLGELGKDKGHANDE